jgi:hephaestin
MDTSSVMWMYHSHVEEVNVIPPARWGRWWRLRAARRGPDGSTTGVDRELMVMFAQMHEEDSAYRAWQASARR